MSLPNDAFWVDPGAVMAGPYPGAMDPDEARRDIGGLLDAGVRTFIDLTDRGDRLDPYIEVAEELAGESGYDVDRRPFPIVDLSIPSPELMRAILDAVGAAAARGRIPYIHCWGGVGRTGTVIGCLLIEDGVPADEVMGRIAGMRRRTLRAGRRAPETAEQRRFIREWPGGGRG